MNLDSISILLKTEGKIRTLSNHKDAKLLTYQMFPKNFNKEKSEIKRSNGT